MPVSGYNIFMGEKILELKATLPDSKARFTYASQQWTELKQVKKDKFNEKAEKAKNAYAEVSTKAKFTARELYVAVKVVKLVDKKMDKDFALKLAEKQWKEDISLECKEAYKLIAASMTSSVAVTVVDGYKRKAKNSKKAKVKSAEKPKAKSKVAAPRRPQSAIVKDQKTTAIGNGNGNINVKGDLYNFN